MEILPTAYKVRRLNNISVVNMPKAAKAHLGIDDGDYITYGIGVLANGNKALVIQIFGQPREEMEREQEKL